MYSDAVKELINKEMFKDSDTIDVLNNQQKLQALYDACNSNNGLINGNNLLKAHLIDLYICELLKGNIVFSEADYQKQLKTYASLQNNRIKDDPFIIFSNPIYLLENRYLRKISDDERIKEIRAYQKGTFTKIKVIADAYLTDNDVSDRNFSLLLNFFNSSMVNDFDKVEGIVATAEKVLQKMIDNKESFNEQSKLFLLNFINKKQEACRGVKALLFVSDYSLGNEIWPDNNYGVSCYNVIFLNRASVISNNNLSTPCSLVKFPQSFFHEFCHIRQYYDMLNENFSNRAFTKIREKIFLKELPKIDINNNINSLNYKASEIEIDARYYSVSETLKFTKKYFPNIYAEYQNELKLEDKTQKWETFCFDKVDEIDGQYHMLPEKYNVIYLNDIIMEKPKYLSTYPILKTFYNLDGTFKGLEELLLNEIRTSRYATYEKATDTMQLYHDYITTYVLDGDLNNIEIANFPKDIQHDFLGALFNHYEHTLKTIEFPLKYQSMYKKLDTNVLNNIITERFKAIHFYEQFFTKNSSMFSQFSMQRQNQLIPYRNRVIKKAEEVLEMDYNNIKFEGAVK